MFQTCGRSQQASGRLARVRNRQQNQGENVSNSGWSRRAACALVVLALVGTACGRSSKKNTTSTTVGGGGGETTTTEASASAAGDFGDLKAVCGPGDAKGATAQGVTDTEIDVATMSDPGNTAVPGLNQEL